MAKPRSVMADPVPWELILDQAAGPIGMLDRQARFVYLNPAACAQLGHDRDFLIGRCPSEFTHPDDPAIDKDTIDRLIDGPTDSFDVEKRFLRADGSAVWALVTSSLIRNVDGEPLFLLSQLHDITARRESELLWQRTLAHAPIGMALLDLDGKWTEVNDKLCDLVGYNRDDLLTMHFTDLTYPEDVEKSQTMFADLLLQQKGTVSLEKRYRHKDGHAIWMLIRYSVVPGADDKPACLIGQYESIGDGRLQDRHLAHMALHDPLTGLANRALLMDRLDHSLAELPNRQGGVLAVLLVDVDNLKPVNDNHGHVVGDKLLITTADELLNSVRAGDTVARLGGDEFVVLSRVADFGAAEAFRDRVSTSLDTDVAFAGHRISLSASVGLATTQNPLASVDALLHSADRDMYKHKKRQADGPRRP